MCRGCWLTTESDRLADVVADVIRARVHPLVSAHVGHHVVSGLKVRGYRVVRSDRQHVNADWLATVLSVVDYGPLPDASDTSKAAAYDRLVATINAHERGRT